MSQPESPRRIALAVKAELTPGVSSAPTFADNALQIIGEPSIEEFYQSENLRTDVVYGGLGQLAPEIPVGRAFRIGFRIPLIGPGAVISAVVLPPSHPVLLAAGLACTVDTTVPGSEKATYDWSDDPVSTISLALEWAGHKYALTYGVVEQFNVTCEAGGFPVADVRVLGIAAVPTDQVIETATYVSTAYPIWRGANSLEIAGVAGITGIRSVNLTAGMEVVMRRDANMNDVFAGSKIMRRNPMLQLVNEVSALSNFNPLADKLARTLRAIDVRFGQLGAAYTKVAIDIDNGRTMAAVGPRNDSGLLVWDTQYQPSVPATTKECSLIFS